MQQDAKNISKNAKDLFNKQADEVSNILNTENKIEEINNKNESNEKKDPIVKKNQ